MSLVGIVSRELSAKLNPNRLVKCGALFTGSRVGIASDSPAEVQKDYPVCSDTEWDPLEEVILGRPDGSCYSDLNMDMKARTDKKYWSFLEKVGGLPWDPDIVNKATAEVEEYSRILQMEGVRVRRPEPIRWDEIGPLKTPYFESKGQLNCCPRDAILIVGDEIIESPMAWMSRVFEFLPYRKILNDYFKRGARWIAAPRPTMADDTFNQDYPFDDEPLRQEMALKGKFVLSETEPCLDAADVTRFGKDLLVTYGHCTNRTGVEWLKRHLEPQGYTIHTMIYKGIRNTHADSTVIPLRPGLLLFNPVHTCEVVNDEPSGTEYFTKRGWDVISAPEPIRTPDIMYVSRWITLNTLNLGHGRILMQKGEEPLKKLFIKYGFKPIEVDMTNAYHLGGGLHCWTVDVKRQSEKKNYLS